MIEEHRRSHKAKRMLGGQPDQRKREKVLKETFHSGTSPSCMMGLHMDYMPKAHACRRDAIHCECDCHKGKLF
jgi:hypothetical protein